MKNLYYSLISLPLVILYDLAKLINTMFRTNIGKFGKINDNNFDPDEFEKELLPIDIYKALVKSYFEIHNTVFNGVKSVDDFIIPNFWLLLTYTNLLQTLKIYQDLDQFKNLPKFSFSDYPNLEINAEGMIANYPKKRKETLEYMALLEKLFYEKCKTEGYLPDYIQGDIQYYNELINEHKEKRNLKNIPVRDLIFTKKGSTRERVYLILKANNDYVSSRELCKKSKVKYDDLRSIITQLRVKIIEQGLNDTIGIESAVNQGYKYIRNDAKPLVS